MEVTRFQELREMVIAAGFGDEIVWQESLKPCDNADEFFNQYMWVVLSSGMKNQVARIIESRIYAAWAAGKPTSSAFNHQGKVKAIDIVRLNKDLYFNRWKNTQDKILCLNKMPWIGSITAWHLAKNLGDDVVKPDRHLVRLSQAEKTTPQELCQHLADQTGYRIATVDLILWRAANLGFI